MSESVEATDDASTGTPSTPRNDAPRTHVGHFDGTSQVVEVTPMPGATQNHDSPTPEGQMHDSDAASL